MTKNDVFYQVSYTVSGTGTFPLDMLRYDRSCPESEADSQLLRRSGERQIHLVRFTRAGKSGPCVARWASFGWKVLRVRYHDGTEETLVPPYAPTAAFGPTAPTGVAGPTNTNRRCR